MQLKNLACPTRHANQVGNGYCEAPVFAYAFMDIGSCGQAEVTNVFADGLVQYYWTEASFNDVYGQSAPDTATRLRTVVEDLIRAQLPFDEVLVPGGGPHYHPRKHPSPLPRQLTGYHEFATRLRTVVNTTIGIAPAVPAASSCEQVDPNLPRAEIVIHP
jgi:hypothetical protein